VVPAYKYPFCALHLTLLTVKISFCGKILDVTIDPFAFKKMIHNKIRAYLTSQLLRGFLILKTADML